MQCTIEYACISDQGKIRAVNQDNFYCDGHSMPLACTGTEQVISGTADTERGVLFAVFDGMGGEQCGEDASFIAATVAGEMELGNGSDSLRSLCMEANRRIVAFTEKQHLKTCGSTAALLLFEQDRVYVCNLGDSKIFWGSAGQLTQLSKDHVLQVPTGRKAPLVQFLGVPENEMTLVPHLKERSLKKHDQYVICSDGLTDMVDEKKIAAILAEQPDLKSAAQALVDAALAAGGHDNITVILIKASVVRKGLRGFWPFNVK